MEAAQLFYLAITYTHTYQDACVLGSVGDAGRPAAEGWRASPPISEQPPCRRETPGVAGMGRLARSAGTGVAPAGPGDCACRRRTDLWWAEALNRVCGRRTDLWWAEALNCVCGRRTDLWWADALNCVCGRRTDLWWADALNCVCGRRTDLWAGDLDGGVW